MPIEVTVDTPYGAVKLPSNFWERADKVNVEVLTYGWYALS